MSLWKREHEPRVDKPQATLEESETTDIDALPTLEEKYGRMFDDFNDLFEDSKEDEYYYCRACKIRFKTLAEAEEHEETPEHFAKEEAWKSNQDKFYSELKEERRVKKAERKEARLRRRQRLASKASNSHFKPKARRPKV
ncbi:Protein 21.4 [Giardia muris]|uniref:Protein 21.4 n=1 Tax=Giardia muris TaxID=5742 RepID=A0A4Z1T493_GIAMU|nr:Protein 21.4 [Giardia muris]|eukprot:TNJ27349.1 Protein 21.4 [Giardia muris]